MKLFRSVKLRLTIWYLAVLGSLLVVTSLGVYFSLSQSLYQGLDSALELQAARISRLGPLGIAWKGALPGRDGGLPDLPGTLREAGFSEVLGEVVYFYFRQDGELVKISTRDVDIAEASQLVDQAMGGQSSFATTETSEGQRIRLHAFPLQGATVADEPVAVVIGRSAEDIDQALQRLAIILTVSAVVAMTLAGGGGWFLARRSLKPVEDITRTARKIEESDLGRRIEVGTDDELGRLAFTLNQMIGRLERAFDRQRQFTADASHELRTPLAIIQAESTRALQKEGTATGYQESLEMISEEAGAMRGLIDRLLTLARVDSGTEPTRSGEINLRALVTDLASDAEVLCQEKGLQFKLGQLEDLAVKGDEAKLKVMFLGLLDNAVIHTPPGGTVCFSFDRCDTMAKVIIRDTGIGIPPEHLPHIFERFYRVDKARSRAQGGAGLGLAISKDIAESHGGRIEAESAVGEGSIFSVALPLLEQT